MSGAFDVVVIGSGPAAAAAARMLDSLELSTLLVTPAGKKGDDGHVPQILLPESALAALDPLGLRESIVAAGTLLGSHEIRWPGPEPAEVPGRSSGLQISEPTLRERLLRLAATGNVEVREARDVSIVYQTHDDYPRVAGVKLSSGSTIETGIVLCAITAPLHHACRPRPAGATDIATMHFLENVDAERFPLGHHYVACAPDSWWWALRDDTGLVQLTRFTTDTAGGRDSSESTSARDIRDAPGNPFVTAELATSLPRRDATPTLPGAGPWPDGLFAIGSALYRVAPVSSLGTAQAIRSARAAVAAANTILASEVGARDASRWYVDASTMRAARTHALTAEVCRQPLERFGSPFWRERATDLWALDVLEPIAEAARAARRSLSLANEGDIMGTTLLPSSEMTRTSTYVERGPKLVEQRGVVARGGRTIAESLWQHLSPVARAFGVADPFADRNAPPLPQTPITTLGELLEVGDPELTTNPKRTRRAVGALVEAGVLTFAK